MVAEKDTKPTLGQDTATESLRATDNAQKGRGQPMFLLQIHNSETAYSTENRSSSPWQFLKIPCTGDLSHQETQSARCPSIKPAEHAVGFMKVAKSGHHFAISAWRAKSGYLWASGIWNSPFRFNSILVPLILVEIVPEWIYVHVPEQFIEPPHGFNKFLKLFKHILKMGFLLL